MRWARTVRHQVTIVVSDEVFNAICESDFDDDMVLIINGEYIADVQALPTYEELVEYIDQMTTLNDLADVMALGVE